MEFDIMLFEIQLSFHKWSTRCSISIIDWVTAILVTSPYVRWRKRLFSGTVLLSWFKWKKIYEVQFWPQSIPSGINKPFQAKTKSFNDGPWKNPPPLSPFSRNPSLSPLPSRPTPCPTALKNTGTNTNKSTKNSLKNNLVFQGTG